MEKNVMDIAYHCTDNYARITATSITSVFENNKDFDEINVYIIDHGFTEQTKNKCNCLANKYRRKIYYISLPDFNEQYGLGLISIKSKWMFDSYVRLFLDRVLPTKIDRVLYLDGDVLVNGDLSDLWNYNLGNKCCAASMDCVSWPYYQLFEMNKSSKYCNSGVILIDLKAWRVHDIDEKVIKYIKENNGYVFFMEQTVFNVVLQNEIKYLPAKYNVSTLMQTFNYNELIRMRKPHAFYSNEEIKDAINNPTIIHMTGLFYVVNRAWNNVTNHPEKELFIKYTKILSSIDGWDDNELQADSRNTKTRIVDCIVHAMPKSVLIFIVSILYNKIRVRHIRDKIRKNKERNG